MILQNEGKAKVLEREYLCALCRKTGRCPPVLITVFRLFWRDAVCLARRVRVSGFPGRLFFAREGRVCP